MFHDEPSFPKLLAQLERKKDPALDITADALTTSDIAMLGMALRALGYGASEGLSHFADPRVAQPLMKFIEDTTWHEEARLAACEALAWCADDATKASAARTDATNRRGTIAMLARMKERGVLLALADTKGDAAAPAAKALAGLGKTSR